MMISSVDSEESYSLGADEEDSYEENEMDRNEMDEIRRVSAKDTSRIVFLRLVVMLAILLTSFAVTFVTYTTLSKQETENFQVAFEQFSSIIGDAAAEQQRDMNDAIRAFANFYSKSAQDEGAIWPFFLLPNYEIHASAVRKQAGLETIDVAIFVKDKDSTKVIEMVSNTHEKWINESHMYGYGHLDRLSPTKYTPNFTLMTPNGPTPDIVKRRMHFPMVLLSPPPNDYSFLNWDLINTFPDFASRNEAMIDLKNQTLVTPARSYSSNITYTNEEHDALHSRLKSYNSTFPHSFVGHPVHKIPGDYNSEMVAFIDGSFAWDLMLRNLLPVGVDGIIVEVKNNCNQSFTYEIDGPEAYFVGAGGMHEPKYNDMGTARKLSVKSHPNFTATPGHCYYYMNIFPSSKFEDTYRSGTPAKFAALVAATFGLIALTFLIYDLFVHKRNENLLANAAKSNAIVSSLFPENIRDRIMDQSDSGTKNLLPYHLKSILLDGIDGKALQANGEDMKTKKPLADLFLETTIMFADICGFTAWSSVREPSQVFTLLESVYGAFDQIAKRRRIFKVETVGDCYVAVSGLPEPRRDHAVVMSRFACDIMTNMQTLAKSLEVTLGPDTGELTLRIGLHSGPVIGGVLRGARSRFQLFGDTMNTASRIESTGAAGRIHLSQETAELLMKTGKQNWVQRRDQLVMAKGKGLIQTYWLMFKTKGHSSDARSERSSQDFEIDHSFTPSTGLMNKSNDCRNTRLIDWNVEQLSRLIKQIVAHRSTAKKSPHTTTYGSESEHNEQIVNAIPLDEVKEIISLPEFDSNSIGNATDPDMVHLSEEVMDQLMMYVKWISSMYRSNPFHNFDHASHVLMSVIKMMSRIVAPSVELVAEKGKSSKSHEAATLHDHTYGITSDPLTQFACAFSALIHDVDHCGVPNAQLVAEKLDIANRYRERSVAEQNSFDLAWSELMRPRYSDLRATIYTNDCEFGRFRQLIVNSVLATDIVDKDLKALRNARWERAFHPNEANKVDNARDAVNRKATIVIEHLIQASDVSHTMQHWHIFRKWNQRLFEEMYEAYRSGRATKDPSEFWYEGEIGFFDFYVIPLAKKLKDCGVFGVSCDEFLIYAKNNRVEWETRGKEIVAEMVEAVTTGRPLDEKM